MLLLVVLFVVLCGLSVVERRVTGGGGASGTASRGELRAALGGRRLVRLAGSLRPGLLAAERRVENLGIPVGRLGRLRLWASVEDSLLVLGPPRSGKGAGVIVPALRTFCGPAIVTSTRDDLWRHTRETRAARGPVWLFDPTRLVAVDDGARCSWDLVGGCESPLTAQLRARALVAASRTAEGVTNADFWRGSAETVLRCLLHAAALGGRDVATLRTWVAQQVTPEPLALLEEDPRAATGWKAELAGMVTLDDRTRSNVFASVSLALACTADPLVLASVCAGPAAFDVERFLSECGTLYLCGPAEAQQSIAPVIVALVEAVVDRARRRAATLPGGRLDPPLGLFLDEAAQIAPLPSLPKLVADGGGSGITTVVVLQSLAQARDRWGQQAAESIWDACTTRLVLGGLANDADLQRISRLCGQVDVARHTYSHDGTSGSRTLQRMPVFTESAIRGLRPWRALLLHRGLRPAIVRLTPFFRQGEVGLVGRVVRRRVVVRR